MANGHGGARPGAGRPRTQDKYAEQIATFHDAVAQDFGDRYAALRMLADGGFAEEDVEEVWEPAGLVQVTEELVTKEGTFNVKKCAFPALPPDQLVCVQRKVKRRIAAPDRQANQYLIDRIAGKPTAMIEAEVDVDGLDITDQVRAAAAEELATWRKEQAAQLSSLNAPLTPPMPAIPTG